MPAPGTQFENSMQEMTGVQEPGKRPIRLAVLMTCHNRVARTIQSISALKMQVLPQAQVSLILVDDGSKDGTTEAVTRMFPGTTIMAGDGNLYWCGGTRLAFARAMQDDYDFYLWLNDDTSLYPDSLQRLLTTYNELARQAGKALIVAGSTRDPETNEFTYGGWHERRGRLGSISWQKRPPESNRAVFCDTINGNCVLIPREVVHRIGNLDKVFTHSMGDLDYGLRARMKGCRIIIASGYVGECTANDGTGLWTDRNLTTGLRWKALLGPKGLPVKEWWIFCRRHKGILWPLVWVSPYVGFWFRVFLRPDRKAA